MAQVRSQLPVCRMCLVPSLICTGLFGGPVAAQEVVPPSSCLDRTFEYVRSEETAAAYQDRRCDRDALDRLRFIDLHGDGETILSFGGELRGRYELYSETDFGGAPADGDGSFQGRAYVIAGLQHGNVVRGVLNLRYADQAGAENGQESPVDLGGLDLQEAFVEFGALDTLSMRVGRQEISYPLAPPSRLLSARNGPNVRRSWDAVRLIGRYGDWRADAFYARLVDVENGAFDDASDDDTEFWGAYASGPAPWSRGGRYSEAIDLYYYGLDEAETSFQNAEGRETRHTIGLRYVLTPDESGFDLDGEAAWQFGDMGAGDISAGFAAADFGWTTDTSWSWRFGGQLFASTGDSDPSDDDLGTFNELYPSGAYLNDAALLRGQNILSAGAVISARPTSKLSVRGFYTHYWRTEENDGLYAQSGALQRAGSSADAREIGGYLGARARYGLDHRTSIAVQAGHFFAGPFLRDTGASEDTTFFRMEIRWRL